MAHPKGVLLDRAQKLGQERPEFRTVMTGPEHEPSFSSEVVYAGEILGSGQGGTKRTAEKRAAEQALAAFDHLEARRTQQRAEAKAGDEAAAEAEFDGPWPVFDDLLAAVLQVAERRVPAELTGDAARVAVRDFSLKLYKELLADLGEVVEEDEGDEED